MEQNHLVRPILTSGAGWGCAGLLGWKIKHYLTSFPVSTFLNFQRCKLKYNTYDRVIYIDLEKGTRFTMYTR
jgi:hypothetical protein